MRPRRNRSRSFHAPIDRLERLESRRLLAAAGDLDLGYGFMGKATTPFVSSVDDSGDAVALLSDGKILVGGNIWAGVNFPTVSRYLANGAIDTSFGANGTLRATSLAWRSMLDMVVNNSDGSILAISSTASSTTPTIQRFTSSGALDPAWIGPGVSGVTGRPAGVALLSDGRSYFATQTTLARLKTDGTLDTTFGSGGKISFPTAQSPDFLRYDPYAIAVQSDGSILVAGERVGVTTGAKRAFVRKYSSAGVLDTTWAGGSGTLLPAVSSTDSTIHDMQIQGDGRIVVTGRNGLDTFAARFTSLGVMDSAFAGTGIRTFAASTTNSDGADRLVITPSGQIYLGGYADNVGPFIARLSSTGTLDTTYDGNGIIEQPLPTGWPVFGGANIAYNSTSNQVVMATCSKDSLNKTWDEIVTRYTSTGALDTTFATAGMQRVDRANAQSLSRTAGSVMQSDGKLVQWGTSQYVAGKVTLTRLNVNGTADTSFGTGGVGEIDLQSNTSQPFAATVQSDGKIVVVGRADRLVGPPATATWQYFFFVARFNANGTPDPSFGTNGVNLFQYADGYWGYFSQVAMLSSGAIVAAGQFQNTADARFGIVAKFSTAGVLDMSYGGSGTGRKLIDLTGDGELIQAIMPYPSSGTTGGGSNGLVVAGIVDTTTSNTDRFVTRLDDNGNTITTFGTGGVLTLDAAASDENVVGIVGFDPTAGFIQVGSTVGTNLLITRLNGNGTPASGFGVNGTVTVALPSGTSALTDMERTSAGQFLFAGTRTVSGSSDDALVMRLTSAGALDTSFGTNGAANVDFGTVDDEAFDIHIAPTGRLIVGGRRVTGAAHDVGEWAAARMMSAATPPLQVLDRRILQFGAGPRFEFTFNGDLNASVDASDLIAYNLDTGQSFNDFSAGINSIGGPTSSCAWTRASALPDGQYFIEIPAGALMDSGGAEQGEYGFNLFVANGTSGDDTYLVRRLDASNIRVTRTYNGGAPSDFTVPAPAVAFGTGLYLTGGLTGDDSVTVDYSSGEIPAAEIYADGRAGNDTLNYIGAVGATFDISSSKITRTGVSGPQAFASLIGNESLTFDSGQYSFSGTPTGKNVEIKSNAVASFMVTQRLGVLSIAGNVAVPGGGDKVILVTGLTMAPQGRLDLADNDMAINYAASDPSPLGTYEDFAYSGVLGLIQSGYDFTAWDGNGIRTSSGDAQAGLTGLGAGEASDALGLAPGDTVLWNGVTVDGTTVLIKYTYAGDANLDGVIDGGDYGIIDNFVQVPGAGGYFNGDFNYDGVIDGGDYGIIDNNIQAQGGPL